MTPALLPMLATLLLAGAAAAQDGPGDAAAGEKLAREVCANCHMVARDQARDPGVGAPSFLAVAALPAVTEISLRVFLRTPHSRMPDLILSPEETDGIIAYLLSLRQP